MKKEIKENLTEKCFEAKVRTDVFELICQYPSHIIKPEEVEYCPNNIGVKIEDMVVPLNGLYVFTKDELRGYLNSKEALLMFMAFGAGAMYSGFGYRRSMHPRDYLITGIYGYLDYESSHPEEDSIIAKGLLEKVEKMSTCQCYTFTMLINELKDRSKKNSFFSNEEIDEIFLVKKPLNEEK